MRLLFTLLFSVSLLVRAQTTFVSGLNQFLEKPASASFENLELPKSNASLTQKLLDFAKRSFNEIASNTVSLVLTQHKKSTIGEHFTFSQSYKNIPIFGATWQVNVNVDGIIISHFTHFTNTETWQLAAFIPNATLGKAIWIPTLSQPIAGYSKYVGESHFLVDLNGVLLFQQDAKFNYTQEDTMVTAKVFLPDPLTSQRVIYGQDNSYQHYNDSDYVLLNKERKDVEFPATYENNSFILKNKNAILIDREFPFIKPSVSFSPTFYFTRKQAGFKDAMVMYHIYATQQYYQQLGFDELKDYQIKVDAHSSTSDNSSFLFGGDSSLNFGTGGVPDAEDADVICHEYTHALSWFINSSPNMNNERRAIEEGMCDVIAAIMSKKYTDFNWRKLYNFDAPNPVFPGVIRFWNGRDGESSKTYENLTNNFYSDAEIWASTVLDIAEAIGNDTAAILMLQSIYSMSETSTMPQAALLFTQADSILFNKRFQSKIGTVFNNRKLGNFRTGLTQNNALHLNIQLRNTAAFAVGAGDIIIEIPNNPTMQVEIIDVQGKTQAIMIGSEPITIYQDALKAGFYFVKVTTEMGEAIYKILKLY